MSLKSKYSPPYRVTMIDGETTLEFKRMLLEEWEQREGELLAKTIAAEQADINAQMPAATVSLVDRQEARTRMRRIVDAEVTMTATIRHSSNKSAGIRELLDFALVDKSQREWLSVLSPMDVNAIVNEIVYMPVVPPPDPQKLPRPSEASSGGSDPSTSNTSTGPETPPISNPPSPDATPAS